jgi:hypothetical protein
MLSVLAISLQAVAVQAQPAFAPPPVPQAQAEQTPVVAASVEPDTSITPTPVRPSDAQPLEGTEILARIDGEIVLASDVLWQVNLMLDANRDRIPADQWEEARHALVRQQVFGLIDTKVLYAEFRRKVPAENISKIEENLAEPFEEMEIPRLSELLEVSDRAQLDQTLHKYDTSLAEARRLFYERTIAQEWLRQLAPKPKPITHEALLNYYQEHLSEYEHPAQVKWEELMVRFDQMSGDRSAAWRAISEMGNGVWKQVVKNPNLQGPAFAEIAKTRSQGITAKSGGSYDWTNQGSLRYADIDQALFSLEVGQLSSVIETEVGFHIVRVLERKDAGRAPFTETQAAIRKALESEAKKGRLEAELKKLRDSSRIWTIYDGEFRGAELARIRSQSAQR